jgi:hypothetical protein
VTLTTQGNPAYLSESLYPMGFSDLARQAPQGARLTPPP